MRENARTSWIASRASSSSHLRRLELVTALAFETSQLTKPGVRQNRGTREGNVSGNSKGRRAQSQCGRGFPGVVRNPPGRPSATRCTPVLRACDGATTIAGPWRARPVNVHSLWHPAPAGSMFRKPHREVRDAAVRETRVLVSRLHERRREPCANATRKPA